MRQRPRRGRHRAGRRSPHLPTLAAPRAVKTVAPRRASAPGHDGTAVRRVRGASRTAASAAAAGRHRPIGPRAWFHRREARYPSACGDRPIGDASAPDAAGWSTARAALLRLAVCAEGRTRCARLQCACRPATGPSGEIADERNDAVRRPGRWPTSAARAARQAEVVRALSAVLPVRSLLWEDGDVAPYECDGLTAYREHPLVVALPGSEAEVGAVLRCCHRLACRSSRAAPAPACRAVRCRTGSA